MLVDADFQGGRRKLLLWANRNAFFYVLDRATGEFLLAEPYSKQTWAESISATGRPILKPDAIPTPEGTLVYPGAMGATNWYSPSYSPQTDLMYVSVADEYGQMFFSDGDLFGPGMRFVGKQSRGVSGAGGWRTVRAIVPQTGQI